MTARDQIMANIGQAAPEPVEVPEWGVTIGVKRHTLRKWLELTGPEGDEDTRSFNILAESLVDESGAQLMTLDQIQELPAEQAGVLLRLVSVIQSINGGSGDDTGE